VTEDMVRYIHTVGLSAEIAKRVEQIISGYEILNPTIEIEDIFISDYFKQDGSREYESLWLFSKNYILEAKAFSNTDDFDFAKLMKMVTYWNVKKENYDFESFTDKSRLAINISLKNQITCNFKAARENCDVLKKIFIKYISPNFTD
jgi:hypothetical protein